MQLWQDGVVALLAAVGLASLVWTAVRAVLFAGPERRREIGLLLPAQGDGERLEGQIRIMERQGPAGGLRPHRGGAEAGPAPGREVPLGDLVRQGRGRGFPDGVRTPRRSRRDRRKLGKIYEQS